MDHVHASVIQSRHRGVPFILFYFNQLTVHLPTQAIFRQVSTTTKKGQADQPLMRVFGACSQPLKGGGVWFYRIIFSVLHVKTLFRFSATVILLLTRVK